MSNRGAHAVIERHVGREGLFSDETRLDDLGIDSLDVVDLAMDLETTFDVFINDDEPSRWETLGDVCGIVGSALSPEAKPNED